MTDPVLLVIDDDPRELATSERALRRRYGADYRVIALSDGSEVSAGGDHRHRR